MLPIDVAITPLIRYVALCRFIRLLMLMLTLMRYALLLLLV